jgi:hypothetical protein
MAGHWTIQRKANGAACKPHYSRNAIFGGFKNHVKAEAVNIKHFCDMQIVNG